MRFVQPQPELPDVAAQVEVQKVTHQIASEMTESHAKASPHDIDLPSCKHSKPTLLEREATGTRMPVEGACIRHDYMMISSSVLHPC